MQIYLKLPCKSKTTPYGVAAIEAMKNTLESF